MHYIIQEDIFKERHYGILEECLTKFELPYTKVRIFPYVDKIVALEDIPDGPFNVDDLPEYVPPEGKVFCFGAIKMARIAAKRNWTPGSMMNANHDFMVYKDHYKDDLLNIDSIITTIGDDFKWDSESKFIRPTKDTKSFTGKVYTEEEWTETVKLYLHNYRSEIFNEDTQIQVSSLKKIFQEIRCWVVNGKVISASTYKLGQTVIYKRIIDEEPIKYAQSMVDKFQLNDAFVIDICDTPDGWKVVECNCINCSGFYDVDMQKMIMAIDDHFNKV
jgi:hypothetical protein